jgi:hypothetical protein
VAPLIGLEALVRGRIEGLVGALNDRTRHWLGLLFQRSTENSPETHTFRQEASSIVALARYGGVVGPAHEVTNSSALRAYFAFVLALRERVLATTEASLSFSWTTRSTSSTSGTRLGWQTLSGA